MKITVFNKTKEKIPSALIENIEQNFTNLLEKYLQKHTEIPQDLKKASKNTTCNIIINTKDAISALNKKLFKHEEPTDVIAIEAPEPEKEQKDNTIGDIYLCPLVIKENAKKYEVAYEEELARVIIHGMLHLLGFEHIKPYGESDEEMFVFQEELLDMVLKNEHD